MIYCGFSETFEPYITITANQEDKLGLNNAHEGYDYQDLITSYFILKEILSGNLSSSFSVDRKNIHDDRFDDLVIITKKNIQRKQIKYSNENTSKKLKKDYLSSDSTYKISLHMLYETWKTLATPETEFRLCLAWDEPTDADIINILTEQPSQYSSFDTFLTKIFKINLDKLWEENSNNFNRWDSLKKYVNDNKVDRNDFRKFCNNLLIEVALPKASLKFDKPADLERILIQQAEILGIGQYPNDDVYINDFLIRLAKLAGHYRTSSSIISAKDILNELRVRTDYGKIEQKFQIDQNINIESTQEYSQFLNIVTRNKKTLLLGEPGSGKSWFLTNFIKYLEQINVSVIRHYCFTDTDDVFFESRIKTDVFYGNLVSSIIEKFPELAKHKNTKYSANLEELNLLLLKIEQPLVLIIDGLDHIERVLKTSTALSQDKTRILDAISKIDTSDNITIILGSQNVDEVVFLRNKIGYIQEDIPKWGLERTKELMKKYHCHDLKFENHHLSYYLHTKSEGNPLYLTYILKSIHNVAQLNQQFVEELPDYDFNLKSYYDYLARQLNRNTTADILSCLEFSVTRAELEEIVPYSSDFDGDIKILSPVISENISTGGLKIYHDSFRRFNMEKITSKNKQKLYEIISNWLVKQGFHENTKAYRYLVKYLINSEQYKKAKELVNINFLTDSLYNGHSETLIKNNFRYLLKVSERLQDWPFFIYLSELHRTITTTLSEDQQNQILQNFDLYFEAICSIYGANKAHNLLFFNGEKNYSTQITAQAFYILQRYHYSPRWSEVKSLFGNKIQLDNFKYYICYLIEDRERLIDIAKTAINKNLDDFFKVFITEIFNQKGFEEILIIYNEINDARPELAHHINDILDGTSSIPRINIKSINTAHKELAPLDLSFIDQYNNFESTHKFLQNIKLYSIFNTKTLNQFEKNIPTKNFIYNWVKFYIRFLDIEKNYNEVERENKIVKNIEFLVSDTNFFKDQPRPNDFIHYNKNLIVNTIIQGLKYVTLEKSWNIIILSLSKIDNYVPLIRQIERQFLNPHNIQFIIDTYEHFDNKENLIYEEHAKYSFKKAIYYGKIGKKEKAQEELRKALGLITGYTFRKDTSLEEVINPLSVLNAIAPQTANKYVRKLKYLTDAVMKHTEEGKGIRWLTINWFKKLIEIDYRLGVKYLINQFTIAPYFWKLDYMFVDYLEDSHNVVNPIILTFLYKLSPTNTRSEYLNDFLDVLEKLKSIDTQLVKSTLISLSIRDWNNSDETLDKNKELKFRNLFNFFKLNIPDSLNRKSKEQSTTISNQPVKLEETITNSLCKKPSLYEKSDLELAKYLNKLILSEGDCNYLYFFLLEKNDSPQITNLLLPIIRQQVKSSDYFKDLRLIIEKLTISTEDKILLLINNFIYSVGDHFECFSDKDSFKIAVELDKNLSMKILAETLCIYFQNSNYSAESTANLIIAFEYANINGKTIVAMYEEGFKYMESRLPDENQFEWQNIEDPEMLEMNDNELAITLILSKSNNLDVTVQQEIISAMSYLIEYDNNLLIKPLKWFFNHNKRFPQLFIATLLELLLIEKKHYRSLLTNIRNELHNCYSIENLYIYNTLDKILDG